MAEKNKGEGKIRMGDVVRVHPVSGANSKSNKADSSNADNSNPFEQFAFNPSRSTSNDDLALGEENLALEPEAGEDEEGGAGNNSKKKKASSKSAKAAGNKGEKTELTESEKLDKAVKAFYTKSFVGTAIEEAATSEDGNTITVIPHANPSFALKFPKSQVQFLCTASLQAEKYPLPSQTKDGKPIFSALLHRTNNGMDFLKEGIKLKDHQITGVDWITRCFCDRGGAILADDMGLGKTIQAIAFIANLKHSKLNGPHLIVVPYAVVGNWLREIRRFCPQLKCAKIAGTT